MADTIKEIIEVPQSFIREGTQFMNRCTKPDKKEFVQICRAVGLGFVVMGFIGYFVKLIHIPINHVVRGRMNRLPLPTADTTMPPPAHPCVLLIRP